MTFPMTELQQTQDHKLSDYHLDNPMPSGRNRLIWLEQIYPKYVNPWMQMVLEISHEKCVWNESWLKSWIPILFLLHTWISLCPCFPQSTFNISGEFPSSLPRYRWTSAARRNATAGRKPPGASGTLKALPGATFVARWRFSHVARHQLVCQHPWTKF